MSFSWKENLPQELSDKVTKVEKMIQPRIDEIDEQVLYNQQRVLDSRAFNWLWLRRHWP